MHVIVLIKQVPDTTEVAVDSRTGNLIREGMSSVINPDDLHALEVAQDIRARLGGRITVITMGPSQAIDALSEAMGMGADQAILLCDQAFAGADTWATSLTLARAISKVGDFDLICCGRQAIDGDTAQIGPQVADWLDLPQVTYVCAMEEISTEHLSLRRRLEDGYERLRCPLPALITVMGELNTPRYPDMGRLLDACDTKAPIKIWNAADIGVQTREVGLEGSLTHVIKTFAPKHQRAGEILQGDTPTRVRALIDRLAKSESATACKAFAATCRVEMETS